VESHYSRPGSGGGPPEKERAKLGGEGARSCFSGFRGGSDLTKKGGPWFSDKKNTLSSSVKRNWRRKARKLSLLREKTAFKKITQRGNREGIGGHSNWEREAKGTQVRGESRGLSAKTFPLHRPSERANRGKVTLQGNSSGGHNLSSSGWLGKKCKEKGIRSLAHNVRKTLGPTVRLLSFLS